MIPERRRRRQDGRTPLTESRIDGQQLLGEDRGRPAVKNQMMIAPVELVCIFGEPNHGQPHERRIRQTEITLFVHEKIFFYASLSLSGGQTAKVDSFYG